MAATTMARHPPGDAGQEVKINLRARRDETELIDRAARAQGKTRTAFMLESARRAALEALLDQTHILVEDERWQAFVAALDAPPADNQALRRLLAEKAPWDR